MPSWLLHYRREWLGPDLVAGLIVWSVVVPQAAAYAQIAGLPPSAGLVAAPGALLGYALLGTSRTLVVGATTATAAVSAAAVAPLADGDSARFAALSAALALVAAAVFAGAGLLRLGGVMDLFSKPVMTGFLFGLGMTVAIGQLPKLFGVESGTGQFFEQLWALLGNLDETHGWTLAVGAVRRTPSGFPPVRAEHARHAARPRARDRGLGGARPRGQRRRRRRRAAFRGS